MLDGYIKFEAGWSNYLLINKFENWDDLISAFNSPQKEKKKQGEKKSAFFWTTKILLFRMFW